MPKKPVNVRSGQKYRQDLYRVRAYLPVVLLDHLGKLAKAFDIPRADLIRRLIALGMEAEKDVWQTDEGRTCEGSLLGEIEFRIQARTARELDTLVSNTAQAFSPIIWRLLDVGMAQYKAEGLMPDGWQTRLTYKDL